VARTNPIPVRLKQARLRLGVSQKELGIRIGMDPSSASGRMNHYEKGRHVPDIDTLSRIADELQVPLAYFFTENELSAELICLISKLSDSDKIKIINMLKNEENKSK